MRFTFKQTSMRDAAFALLLFLILTFLAGCHHKPTANAPQAAEAKAGSLPKAGAPKEGLSQNADGSWSFVYTLPANSSTLYPDQSWLPDPYKQYYPDLATTIKTFTQQSLTRGGLQSAKVSSVSLAYGKPLVVISGNDNIALSNFAAMHQSFLSSSYAPQGLNGVNLCKTTTGCWDPVPISGQPWSFFLPFGLPLINQMAVTFLNYPPDQSLKDADYLNNFTMERWYSVLQSGGIQNPYLYESILDARPIAASGSSSQANAMPSIATYFNAPGTDHYYVAPLIELLSNPPTNGSTATLPVIVLGTPALQAWGTIIGQSVGILDVGTNTLPGMSKPTSWVASNHPDVTTYQCCPNDPNPNCCSAQYGCSYSLVPDEQIDLQAACIIQMLAENPPMNPSTAKSNCASAWSTNPSTANQHTICVRAKLDYDFTTTGQCKTQADADAFCNYYQNNACPNAVYTCNIPSGQAH